jgi:hypothetical protein
MSFGRGPNDETVRTTKEGGTWPGDPVVWMSVPRGSHVIGYCAHNVSNQRADATFIAHARTDVPALIALAREQMARADAADAALLVERDALITEIKARDADIERTKAQRVRAEGAEHEAQRVTELLFEAERRATAAEAERDRLREENERLRDRLDVASEQIGADGHLRSESEKRLLAENDRLREQLATAREVARKHGAPVCVRCGGMSSASACYDCSAAVAAANVDEVCAVLGDAKALLGPR